MIVCGFVCWNLGNPDRLRPKSWLKQLADGLRRRANYQYLYHIPADAYFAVPGFSDPVEGDKMPNDYQYKSITDLKPYNDLKQEHQNLTRRYYDLLAVGILNLQTREEIEAHYLKKARQFTWQEFLYNPLAFMSIGFSKVWIWAYIESFFLYGITLFKSVRYRLARWYEKRLLLFDQIRSGQGGSARFAGLFEEIASKFKKTGYSLFYGRSLFNPWLQIGSDMRQTAGQFFSGGFFRSGHNEKNQFL